MRFVKFVNDVGGRVRLPAIPAPQSDFASAEEAVAKALAWEEEVTRHLNPEMVELSGRMAIVPPESPLPT